jgi:electron transfer flavoprotein alpha/beta subunit
MMNILDAENKEVKLWSAENLCVTDACVGLADSPTQMAGLFKPEGGKQAEFLAGDAETQAAALTDRLHRLGLC